jgi:protein transport protein SEC23
VHELGFGLLPKAYVFKGTKEVSKEQILEQMCFFSGKQKPTTGVIAGTRDGLSSESISRFLVPASECEFVLNSVRMHTITIGNQTVHVPNFQCSKSMI